MTDRIKTHLDTLFETAPKTKRVQEMYQELLAGCLDKYEDLTSDGLESEIAFRQVIDGIGDVDELIGHIERIEAFDPKEAQDRQARRAFFTSAGIFSYFFALAMWIVVGYLSSPPVGFAVFVVFGGIGTMLIVFARMTNPIQYEKQEDTMVEDMKVQMIKGSREQRLLGLASSTLWCSAVVIYLLVSFISFAWYVTWIIFPISAGLQCLISGYYSPRHRFGCGVGAYWCFVVSLYFIVSFATYHWAITWIIFVIAVAAQQAFRLYSYWRHAE